MRLRPILAALFLSTLAACADDPRTSNPADTWTPAEPPADASPDISPEDMSDAGPVDQGPDTIVEPDETPDTTPDATPDAGPVDPPREYPPVSKEPLGGERPSNVFYPEGFANEEPLPLVVLLHGYTSSGSGQDFYFQLSDTVDDKRFVLLTPDGTRDRLGNRFWNATNACCDLGDSGIDDESYVRGLIEEAKDRFNIDAGRVYLMGHSNGGFMSYRMACAAAEHITAIASLAGATFDDASACQPSRPVSVLQIHGTADTVIRYNGGRNLNSASRQYPSAEGTAQRWAAYNGCDPTPVSGQDRDLTLGIGEESRTLSYQGCQEGTSVDLWTIDQGSHTPGLKQDFSEQVLDHLFRFDRR